MKSTAALFIDVAKAFDSVNRSILLEKVKSMGIRGKAFTIIQDYLFGRKQVVQTGDYMSKTQFMKHGVPHASRLIIVKPFIFDLRKRLSTIKSPWLHPNVRR